MPTYRFDTRKGGRKTVQKYKGVDIYHVTHKGKPGYLIGYPFYKRNVYFSTLKAAKFAVDRRKSK